MKPIKRIMFFTAIISCILSAGCKNKNTTSEKDKPKKSTFTIYLRLNGGHSVQYGAGEVVKEVETISSDTFFYDITKENTNFRGWGNGDIRYFDQNGKQLVNQLPKLYDGFIFTAAYSTDSAFITLSSNMTGVGTLTGDGEYLPNSNVTVTATPKQGYTFSGWYLDSHLVATTETYKFVVDNLDKHLVAFFDYATFGLSIRTNVTSSSSIKPVYFIFEPDFNTTQYQSYSTSLKYQSVFHVLAVTNSTTLSFIGWYDDSNNIVSYNAYLSATMPNHNLSLIARWA